MAEFVSHRTTCDYGAINRELHDVTEIIYQSVTPYRT